MSRKLILNAICDQSSCQQSEKKTFTLARLAVPYYWNTEKTRALTAGPHRDNYTLRWHKLELNTSKKSSKDQRDHTLHRDSTLSYTTARFSITSTFYSEASGPTSCERWSKDPDRSFASFSFFLRTWPSKSSFPSPFQSFRGWSHITWKVIYFWNSRRQSFVLLRGWKIIERFLPQSRTEAVDIISVKNERIHQVATCVSSLCTCWGL